MKGEFTFMTHWLAVTVGDNWSKCVATKTWGVSDLYSDLIKSVAMGDDMVVHIVGMKCAGIFRITKPYFHSEERIYSDDLYPHRVLFEPLVAPKEPVDIKSFFYSTFRVDPRGYFRRGFRELPDNEFQDFRDFLEHGTVAPPLETTGPPPSIEESQFALSLERDLENYLEGHLQEFEPGMTVYREKELTGRQFETDVGRIDLLAQDSSKNFVVIELKAGEADRTVLGQVLSYMGWVKEHLAHGKTVRGIVIAFGFSHDIIAATNVLENLTLSRYSVQFTFSEATHQPSERG
jgi:hypothetical protein